MGDEARKAKYKILGRVVKKKLSFDTYLITLPSNPSNILDVYSANVLLQPHLKEKRFLKIHMLLEWQKDAWKHLNL